MNKWPLVSIIVASYNHERYILTMLESILLDDYENKELIIVNDGSKDNSHQIIIEWIEDNKQKIPITYKFRENKGVCRTLNELIDLSNGKYLLPIPSDDALIPGTIYERVKILEDNPTKKILVTDSLVIDENNEVIMDSSIIDYNGGDKSKFINDESILQSTLIAPQISGPNILIKKDIYEIVGRSKENLIAEDWYFYQRAAAKNFMIFKDITCGKYRVHSNNSSGKAMSGSYKMAWTIVLTYWYNWRLMPDVEYKLIALKELSKWFVRYCIYRLKA